MTTITITLLIILNIIFMIKFEYDKKERFLTVFTLNKSSSLINLKFKFPKRLNMKLSLIFFLFLFTLSCKKENTRYTVIPIKNFSQEIEMDRILSDIQILRLNIPDTTFIGQIKDLAIYRDSIYILDDIKQSLFIFVCCSAICREYAGKFHSRNLSFRKGSGRIYPCLFNRM